MRDAFSRCVRAMCASERVVDVDIAKRAQPPRKASVVRFFLGMKADVFQQQDVTWVQTKHQRFGLSADAIGSESHILAQEFSQVKGQRLQSVLGVGLTLRTPQVRSQHHTRATLHR